ncbi:uncharacterized protein LOC122502412 [Leptopilina heterotoma]|uniref:uncharacterized protein LOC122502412 n=1 Tax=Leptopilina heterotoma TaxID=63436 RepID=UPI001CA826AE|nr:uncharacterized protein LOC122502412 [Leptopilina heterotoma]
MSALVLPRLSFYMPPKDAFLCKWKHLKNLDLADPEPFKGKTIEIIIGADYYDELLMNDLCKGQAGTPIAQKTKLGWILSGPTSLLSNEKKNATINQYCTTVDDLQRNLKLFWELEELPQQNYLTVDEQKAEDYFLKTHTREEDGRYCVRLPLKENALKILGNSLNIAKKMLNKTEQRLKFKPELQCDYYKFLNEYKDLGHIVEIKPDVETFIQETNAIYLPFFPIIKENSLSTRVRLVFNGSCKTSSGFSVNELLLIGPKLHNDIIAIILHWRRYRYVMTTDISKMFRQILVDKKDVDCQRIVCRLEPEGNIKHFQLLTVTYGMSSSPFLANRVLKQLAQDEGLSYPLAKKALENEFYVDDGLIGANDIQTARELKRDLTKLLKKGGFVLDKWSTNNPLILDTNKDCINESPINLTKLTEKHPVLGILWDSRKDEFCYSVSTQNCEFVTKRLVLSLISKLFDPLGWVSPITIVAKIFIQEIWLKKLQWDDELDHDLLQRWIGYYNELPKINMVKIPRWTLEKVDCQYEIHGFADASKQAYGAVVYLRVLNKNEQPNITLLISKSKVAPLKVISVPRLELCAVVILAKLIKKVLKDLHLEQIPIFGWTDSTVALSWLRDHPSK